MNLNPDKCHLPLNINEQNTLNTGNLTIKDSLCGKVHGIANHIEAKNIGAIYDVIGNVF